MEIIQPVYALTQDKYEDDEKILISANAVTIFNTGSHDVAIDDLIITPGGQQIYTTGDIGILEQEFKVSFNSTNKYLNLPQDVKDTVKNGKKITVQYLNIKKFQKIEHGLCIKTQPCQHCNR